MENIRVGKKDATDEEVIAAAKAAQCDEFISKLSDGYQTVIGEMVQHYLAVSASAFLSHVLF